MLIVLAKITFVAHPSDVLFFISFSTEPAPTKNQHQVGIGVGADRFPGHFSAGIQIST
jgi:hypothetical protein